MWNKAKTLAERLIRPFEHTASKRTAEFLLGSVAVAWVAGYITYYNHQQDVVAATRNSAVSAVSDISDLTSERRERAALVISSVTRGAPQEETQERKKAYDEAYVKWNSKIPGELLRVRASLNLDFGSYVQDYVEGLTDTDRLKHLSPDKRDSPIVAYSPGLLSIMDKCVTRAYDAYRSTKYEDNKAAAAVAQDCRFIPMYNNLIICVSDISRVLYAAVIDKLKDEEKVKSDSIIGRSCMPPEGSVKWNALPPPLSSAPAHLVGK